MAATTRAYEHRDRLTEVERQLTAAFYYSTVDVDVAKEEAAYRRVLAISPDNTTATNNLSLLLGKTGPAGGGRVADRATASGRTRTLAT